MKIIKILSILGIAISSNVMAQEISIYNSNGEATAYIDTDDELTIYLWNGKPTSYLDGNSIYGFNGNHLGWLENGVIRDHNGDVVGGFQNVITYTQLEPLKGLKELTPLKNLQELEPLKPLFSNSWSREPLSLFLMKGM